MLTGQELIERFENIDKDTHVSILYCILNEIYESDDEIKSNIYGEIVAHFTLEELIYRTIQNGQDLQNFQFLIYLTLISHLADETIFSRQLFKLDIFWELLSQVSKMEYSNVFLHSGFIWAILRLLQSVSAFIKVTDLIKLFETNIISKLVQEYPKIAEGHCQMRYRRTFTEIGILLYSKPSESLPLIREMLQAQGFDSDVHTTRLGEGTESCQQDRFILHILMSGMGVEMGIGSDFRVRKTLLENLPKTSCFVCGKQSNIHWCANCRSVAYCGRKCQKKHWKKHKKVCKALKRPKN